MTRLIDAQHDDPDVQEPGLLDRQRQPAAGRRSTSCRASARWRRTTRRSGTFILDGIPPAPRGVPQIEVTFDIDANGILDVKAKDKATSKEQSVAHHGLLRCSRRTRSTGWSREAEAHAEEDRQRRDEVETRNQADALAFQAERTLKDLGDKVSSEDRTEVEGKIEAVRSALKGDDDAAIGRSTSELTESLQRVAAKAYQAGATPDFGGDGASEEAAAGCRARARPPRRRRRPSRASSRRSSQGWRERRGARTRTALPFPTPDRQRA